MLGAKQRHEICQGKLWEITRLCGRDVFKTEKEPPRPEPFKKPKGGNVIETRFHMLKREDDVTNITKNTDVL